MSDFKYQSLEQLKISKQECEKYISNLKSSLAGQEIRLNWIDDYIFENTPQEMTIQEIEKILGHKIILSAYKEHKP